MANPTLSKALTRPIIALPVLVVSRYNYGKNEFDYCPQTPTNTDQSPAGQTACTEKDRRSANPDR